MDGRIRLLTEDLGPRVAGDPLALEHAARELQIVFPDDYADFMRAQDGGEGWIGEGYISLWPASELVTSNRDLQVGDSAPNLVVIGTDGGGEALAFDRSTDPPVVVTVPLIGLDQPILQGTFLACLERLRVRSPGPMEFQSMRTWYFVLHLPHDRQRPGARYEVQLLDRDGRALAWVPYDEETSLLIEGVPVPAAVLAVGRAQPPGIGDYVDEHGNPTEPF